MTDILSVYYHGSIIGTLSINKGRRYVFSYMDEWLQKEDAIPISISLPLTPGEFDEDKSMSFFSNLLPESTIRDKLAKKYKLSEDDSYGLLEIIGGECAGAISILPSENKFEDSGEYKEISNDELSDILEDISKRPFLAGEKGLRLSLAGAQDKIPIYYNDDKFYLTKGNNASTHIIKTPISDDYPYSVINEVFCMKLAKELGFQIPEVTIIRNTRNPFYLIERYDRFENDNGEIIRLHQEDFCQALSITPEQKYEKEGGPSLTQCFKLVDEHSTNPAKDKQYLLKWIMFNILIGNADSHAKNLSFLYDDGSTTLSPFYDLLCTKIYPELNDDFSMRIGDKWEVRYLSVHEWKKLAKKIGVKFSIFPELRKEILNDLNSKIKEIKRIVCVNKEEEDFIQGIEDIIQERSRVLLRIK